MLLASSPTIASTSSNATTITLTWTQPPGEVVDQYLISFSYTEVDCGFTGSAMIPVPGTSTQHTLLNTLDSSGKHKVDTVQLQLHICTGDIREAVSWHIHHLADQQQILKHSDLQGIFGRV